MPGTAPARSRVTAVRDLRAAAVAVAPFVALMWLVAAGVAATADDYDQASWWLLLLNQLVLVPALAGAAWWLGRTVRGAGGSGRVPPRGRARAGARRRSTRTSGFRETYTDRVLTEAVGIAAGGRFAAGALLLGAVALLVAAVTRDRSTRARRSRRSLALVVSPSPRCARGSGWTSPGARSTRTWAACASSRGATACSSGCRWQARSAWRAARVPAAVLLGGWFGAFALAWGASPNVDVGDGSFSVAFVPALPAFSLLVASRAAARPDAAGAPGTARAGGVTPWSRGRPSRGTPPSAGRSDR